MNISISHASGSESIDRMKANKACGPDNVSPKLFKYAGKDLIPSLLSQFSEVCAEHNSVPTSWKTGNVSALFKKDDETDKQNYHSLYFVLPFHCLKAHHVTCK